MIRFQVIPSFCDFDRDLYAKNAVLIFVAAGALVFHKHILLLL